MRPLALVADAHQGSLDLATYLLELGGFRVRGTRSGAEALRLAPKLRPDVAVVDLNCDDIDTAEVRELLATDAALREIPVVITTGTDLTEPCADLARANVVLFIRKPVEPATLAAQVRGALSHPG